MNVNLTIGEKFLPLFSDYEQIGIHGGRGSSKSHTVAEVVVAKMEEKQRRVVGARQFQKSIAESSKEVLEVKIKKFGLEGWWIGRDEIVNEKNGSRATFIGLDRNPESIKSLEGSDICWVEEARTTKVGSIEMLVPTVLRKAGSQIIWTWNPGEPDDPIETYLRGPEPPPNTKIIEATIEDNPYFYQTRLVKQMEHMKKHNYERYLHIWRGGYNTRSESQIFKNTRIGRINTEGLVPQFGLDFGFSNDPAALIKVYVSLKTNQIYIAQETFGKPKIIKMAEWMSAVTESNRYTIIGDSSRPELIDYLNGEGYTVVPSRKGPGSLKTGIEWLQGFDIIIDPDCPYMQNEARLYSYEVDPYTKKVLNDPCDSDNHGWDAVRYATEQNRSNNTAKITKVRM